MKTNYLFPHKYKKVGWILLIPTLIIGLVFFGKEPEFLNFKVFALIGDNLFTEKSFFSSYEDNILNELIGILLIFSSLLVGFSKEKVEDEYITSLRMKSLARAVYINYGILLFSFFTVYGLTFFFVAIFNIFTFLLFFIAIFNFNLWKSKKSLGHEE